MNMFWRWQTKRMFRGQFLTGLLVSNTYASYGRWKRFPLNLNGWVSSCLSSLMSQHCFLRRTARRRCWLEWLGKYRRQTWRAGCQASLLWDHLHLSRIRRSEAKSLYYAGCDFLVHGRLTLVHGATGGATKEIDKPVKSIHCHDALSCPIFTVVLVIVVAIAEMPYSLKSGNFHGMNHKIKLFLACDEKQSVNGKQWHRREVCSKVWQLQPETPGRRW